VAVSRLNVIYASQGIAFGLLMPFPVPLLVERGLGAAAIGLILAVTGLASLLAYPVWGVIADGWLGRPRTIALAGTTAAGGGLLIVLAGDDPLLLAVALSVAVVGALAWGPLTDALALGLLGSSSSSYGRVRVWASVGWAGSATAGGWLWTQAGPGLVFGAFIAGSLAMAVLVLWAARGPWAAADESEAAAHRPSLRGWLQPLLAPLMLGFLAALFVTAVGEHASWRFISLRILDQGGGVFLVGLAAALPAIVEIPVFASSRQLATRLGLRRLFVVGAFLAAALMALVVVATEPWMATGLRTLEGASFAMRYTAMVLIVGVLMPSRLHALGQSVAWLVYSGVAPIAADAAGGLVYDTLGAEALFALATLALGSGGVVAWVVLRGPEFGPRRVVEAVADVPAAGGVPPPR
jgi:MFS family permease